jgi:hypothetical protein
MDAEDGLRLAQLRHRRADGGPTQLPHQHRRRPGGPRQGHHLKEAFRAYGIRVLAHVQAIYKRVDITRAMATNVQPDSLRQKIRLKGREGLSRRELADLMTAHMDSLTTKPKGYVQGVDEESDVSAMKGTERGKDKNKKKRGNGNNQQQQQRTPQDHQQPRQRQPAHGNQPGYGGFNHGNGGYNMGRGNNNYGSYNNGAGYGTYNGGPGFNGYNNRGHYNGYSNRGYHNGGFGRGQGFNARNGGYQRRGVNELTADAAPPHEFPGENPEFDQRFDHAEEAPPMSADHAESNGQMGPQVDALHAHPAHFSSSGNGWAA